MTNRWPSLIAAIGLLTLGLLMLAGALVAGTGGDTAPSRADGSTWSDGPRGATRLFRLVEGSGQPVGRHEGDLASLPERGMLVVLAPPGGLTPGEEDALLRRVERGADLLLASESVPPALSARGLRMESRPLAGIARAGVPALGARAGQGLVGAGDELLTPLPGLAPVFAAEEGVRLGILVAGEGTVTLLTDPALLSNAGLDDPVAARLAFALFTNRAGTVWFVEGLHGYTEARGLLPWLWRSGHAAVVACGLLAFVIAGWRAAGAGPAPPSPALVGGGGLARLAMAIGRMRHVQGLHDRALRALVREARRRRIPEDHPALRAGHGLVQRPSLSSEEALRAATELERVWR